MTDATAEILHVGKLAFERQPLEHESYSCPYCEQAFVMAYRVDVTSESHVQLDRRVNSEREWTAHIEMNRHHEMYCRSKDAIERRYDELTRWRNAGYHESAPLALAQVHAFVHGEVEALRRALDERVRQLKVLDESLFAFQAEAAP